MSDLNVEENNEKVENKIGEIEPQVKSEHAKALSVVDKTKQIIEDAQTQVNECMLLLKEDLTKFEESKKELRESALNDSEKLLLGLGYESDMLNETEEAKIDFEEVEAKAQEGRVEVKEVSSGKFYSFIVAFFFGMVLALGILYAAAGATGVSFDAAKLADVGYLTPLLVWIGDKAMGNATLGAGAGVLGLTTLIFAYLIYIIRVSLRASKNLREAKVVYEEAEFYCTQKDECKAEMERVDAHLHDTIDTINFYKVLLQEQNMRLKRILFIEEKQEFHLYHYKSQADLENTQRLVNGIMELLSTPIAAQGKLSTEAQEALAGAKVVIDNHIKAIYDNNVDDIF
jgi:hypothetical protein